MSDETKVIDFVKAEIDYCRKKQWDIFAWSATLLLASIGTVVALAARKEFNFSPFHRGAMIVALATITLYACIWIRLNIHWESRELTSN